MSRLQKSHLTVLIWSIPTLAITSPPHVVDLERSQSHRPDLVNSDGSGRLSSIPRARSSQSHRPDLVNSDRRFTCGVPVGTLLSQSHRPDLVTSDGNATTPRRAGSPQAKSQSHRPDLVNPHQRCPGVMDGTHHMQSRNPTVLIWSIPTARQDGLKPASCPSGRRNPTVLIWVRFPTTARQAPWRCLEHSAPVAIPPS